MDVGDRIGTVRLETSGGEPVDLQRLLDRPTVVQLLRYYG